MAEERTQRPVALAARLYVLDRWPTVVDQPWVWERFAFESPFDYRWNERPVPEMAQRHYDALVRTVAFVHNVRPVAEARGWRNRRNADRHLESDLDIAMVNVGPGGRKGNSFHVALAVDAHLNGSPSTAMSWAAKEDPILVVPIDAVARTMGGVERVISRAAAEDLVRAWGPGAKAIVSLRDPDSTFHRLFNVTNRGGQVRFLDYSAKGESDPQRAADATLATVDERSPFASIQLWRTCNLPGQSRLPDDFLSVDDETALQLLGAALPNASATRCERALAKIRFADDPQYTFWLVEQMRNGGCTFLPPDLARVATAPSESWPEPLSQLDDSLIALAGMGHAKVWGDRFEITAPDLPVTHRLIATIKDPAVRCGSIDGLAPGTIEVSITADLLRQPNKGSHIDPSDLATAASTARPRQPRQFSWLDVNRAISPGQRKTNCWNCAAAVAQWLTAAEPSSGLPIYPRSGFRPTIPEYVQLLQPTTDTVFVTNKHDAEEVVRSWGAHSHGLVVAGLNPTSTHMFNVVFDGERVRYLDGYVSKEGDFNFDITWERIGVVRLGVVAPVHRTLAGSTLALTSPADSRSPNRPGRDQEDGHRLLSL